jgi:protein SPT2
LQYQKLKARALELQKQKDSAFQRELQAKTAKEEQSRREEDERRKKKEAAIKEARRVELARANEALLKNGESSSSAKGGNGGKSLEYDPFAEDEKNVKRVHSVIELLKVS